MEYKIILESVGAAAILMIIIMFGLFLWNLAAEALGTLKWHYKRKHRFDKPPVAKCYCKDCKYYSERTYVNICTRGHIENWSIADNYFCWQAEPLLSDPELKRTSENEVM